jgi:hypothetical protein
VVLRALDATEQKQALPVALEDEDEAAEHAVQICLLTQRLVVNFTLNLVISCEQGLWQPFLEHLASLAGQLLNASYVDMVETATSEAFELVVEAWSHLVESAQQLPTRQEYVSLRMPCLRIQAEAMLKPYTNAIVRQYMAKRLEFGRLEIESGEDVQEQFHGESQMTEMLGSIAQIARVDVSTSCELLAQVCRQKVAAFQALARDWRHVQPSVELAVLQEELFWLVGFAGHLLADDTDACIPDALLLLSISFEKNTQDDSVIFLSRFLFDLAAAHVAVLHECCEAGDPRGSPHASSSSGTPAPGEVEKPPVLSPLLLTTLLGMLARWSAAYLMPAEASHSRVAPNLWNAFGQATAGGKEALQTLVRVAHAVLLLWSEERELCDAACDVLRAMVLNKRVRPELIAAQEWWAFADMYHGGHAVVSALGPGVLVTLAKVVCIALAEGPVEHEQERQARFKTLVEPVRTLLLRDVAPLSPQQQCALPLAQAQHLSLALLQLQGFAQSNGAYAFPYAFAALTELFPVLVQLLGSFAAQRNATVVARVVRVFSALADSELYYLEEKQVCLFMQHAGHMLDAYFTGCEGHLRALFAAHPEGKQASSSSSPPSHASEEDVDDVAAVLGLLERLNRVDDFCLDDGHFRQAKEGAMRALFFGVTRLLPFVNPAAFPRMPTASFQFYGLLQDMLMRHEELLAAQLSGEQRAGLVCALAHGVGQQDGKINKLSLELIVAMVTRPGWLGAEDLSLLLGALFDLLMFERFSVRVLRLVSDAVFSCIVADLGLYERMALAFVQGQEVQLGAQGQQALLECFRALKADGGLQLLWDEQNKALFQQNTERFLVHARSLVSKQQ